MNCPKCEGVLKLEEGEGHIGYVCEKCKGMWLSNKYIETIKHNYQFEPAKFINTLSEKYIPTELSCPTCKTNLNNSSFNKIELDWCHTCNGVWFDKNELDTLTKLYKKEETAGEKMFIGVEILALFFSI